MALIDEFFRAALAGFLANPHREECTKPEAISAAWDIAELAVKERKRRSEKNSGLYQFAPEDDGVSYESALPRG